MTYARARLWLGISTVGFWVVLAVSALVWHLPARFLPTQPSKFPTDLLGLLAVFGLYAVLSLPSDLWGGLILPRRHGRSPRMLAAYFGSWLRGAVVQAVVLTLISLAILAAGRSLGPAAALGVVVLIGAVLLMAQAPLGRLVSGVGRMDVGEQKLRAHLEEWSIEPAGCELWENRDPGFTGGIVGLPGRERLVLPASWISGMGSAATAAHLVRRQEALHSGARARGVAVALVWNWAGFALATLLPGADLVSVAGLALFLSWGTLGLLSRAVHCNAGRPELWVLLSAD